MGEHPTPFLESNALLAEQMNDVSEVERILAEMLPGELSTLSDACERLSERAWAERNRQLEERGDA